MKIVNRQVDEEKKSAAPPPFDKPSPLRSVRRKTSNVKYFEESTQPSYTSRFTDPGSEARTKRAGFFSILPILRCSPQPTSGMLIFELFRVFTVIYQLLTDTPCICVTSVSHLLI